MRTKILIGLAAIAGLLLIRNLYIILVEMGDEVAQGAIYRIIYFHVPGAITGGLAAFTAMVASVLYLVRKNLIYDSLAVSVTEVGLTFGAINLITGMVWARIIWGVWWAWDARLTSMLICILMYSSYLMLRRAIDEPAQRARSSAVLSILTFPGVYITWKSIEWWRTLHPGPVLSFRRGGGAADSPMDKMILWNFLVFLLLAIVLLAIRLRQEQVQRAIDGLRREAHAF
jgi:heme exporter protein C